MKDLEGYTQAKKVILNGVPNEATESVFDKYDGKFDRDSDNEDTWLFPNKYNVKDILDDVKDAQYVRASLLPEYDLDDEFESPNQVDKTLAEEYKAKGYNYNGGYPWVEIDV